MPLTTEAYNLLRARCDKLAAWVDTQRAPNGWASYREEDIPPGVPRVTNEERSALEVYEFIHDPPAKYFLYINEEKRMATTWTGETLGRIELGQPYRDNFGGRRVPVRIHAINGRTYAGTYFTSAGSYARVKLCK